jgi:hypothetical protein
MLIDGLPSSIQSVTISQDVACAQTTGTHGCMATLLLRQVSIHHKFLTPSPIQVAPSTAGAQVSRPHSPALSLNQMKD